MGKKIEEFRETFEEQMFANRLVKYSKRIELIPPQILTVMNMGDQGRCLEGLFQLDNIKVWIIDC